MLWLWLCCGCLGVVCDCVACDCVEFKLCCVVVVFVLNLCCMFVAL